MATINRDTDVRSYNAIVVEPLGKFRRRSPQAAPEQWKFKRDIWTAADKGRCVEQVLAYNRRALKLGWKSWAVVSCDQKLDKYLKAVEKAEVKVSKDREGLELWGSRIIGDEDAFYFRAELTAGFVRLTEEQAANTDLRALAIREIEKVLRKIKKRAKPRLSA